MHFYVSRSPGWLDICISMCPKALGAAMYVFLRIPEPWVARCMHFYASQSPGWRYVCIFTYPGALGGLMSHDGFKNKKRQKD